MYIVFITNCIDDVVNLLSYCKEMKVKGNRIYVPVKCLVGNYDTQRVEQLRKRAVSAVTSTRRLWMNRLFESAIGDVKQYMLARAELRRLADEAELVAVSIAAYLWETKGCDVNFRSVQKVVELKRK